MAAQAILPVLWLVISAQAAEVTKTNTVPDNVSAQSYPQLYSSAEGVYAPSHQLSAAASRLVPVREEHVVLQNNKGFLKDSYGNNFVESPQKFAYKMTYPQQYVKLQDLPLHLSQPLAASAVSYASAPQFSYRTPFTLTSLASKPVHYSTSAFSDIQSLAPNARFSQFGAHGLTPQQLSSNQKPIYTNKQPYKYYANTNNPKFQRLEQKPSSSNRNPNQKEYYQKPNQNKANLKKAPAAAPQKHYIVTTNNGQKTAITLSTNPPLPHLLDLSLLKPLTFANPIVPQVQHYLPKINYHIPKVDEERKQHNEFVVQKTKSYDTSNVEQVPPNEDDSAENDSSEEHDDDHSYEEEEQPPPQQKPQRPPQPKPSGKVNGNSDAPVQTFEITSPGYRETFSQQAVKYDMNAQGEPVVYSYDMKIEKKPVQYSFSHSSNAPPTHSNQVQITEEHNGGPKKVVYSETPDDTSQEEEDDRTIEYEEETPPREQRPPPPPANHLRAEHREEEYHVQPKQQQLPYDAPHHIPHPHSSPPPQAFSQIKVPIQDIQLNFQPFELEEDIHFVPTPAAPQNQGHGHQNQQGHHVHHNQPVRQPPHPHHHSRDHGEPPRDQHFQNQGHLHHENSQEHHDAHSHPPRGHSDGHLNNHNHHHGHSDGHANNHHHGHGDSHKNHEHHGHHENPHPHSNNHHKNRHHEDHSNSQHHHGNNDGHVHHENHNAHPNNQQFNSAEFSEEFPQLNGFRPSLGHIQLQPSPPPQHLQQQQHPRPPSSTHSPPPPKPYSSPAPHIVEKSRKIIIQQETPDEMHSHNEQMTAAVVEEEENNEEDFEKLYKEAAYGFPAYDRDTETNEREIFNPDNYAPEQHVKFDVDHSPFQQYVEEGDEFPKAARLNYKDSQENMKEDYYLDYSVKKPESVMERYKNKVDYYKMFKKHREPSFFGFPVQNDQQPKKSEPYTVQTIYGYAPQQKKKQKGFFAQYKNAPAFEFDYSKEAPKDSFAHASKPSYKAKTLFVEPQFQYGFEPLSLPQLFDSELSAMASNDNPKSDKDGKRKKIYKENWYIKKTTTSGGKPAS